MKTLISTLLRTALIAIIGILFLFFLFFDWLIGRLIRKAVPPLSAAEQLAYLFPPMLRSDGANIQLSDLDAHYQTHHLPPRGEVERLIAERDSIHVADLPQKTPQEAT